MASDRSHAHAPVDDGAVHAHISKAQFYWAIFGLLVVLTIITVKVSYYDFGSLNIVVALLIATIKASLVAAFFMHLRHDNLFNTIAFLSAFLFLSLFILLTYDDLGRRGQIDNDYGGTIQLDTGLAAPGGLPATSATANEASGEAAPRSAGGKGGGAEKKE
ncbi:MAG: cytochrome C oxidase subunit IV family protein [Polyangiaceae bacterium]|jgi:cytochrome c oxidase subunit 4